VDVPYTSQVYTRAKDESTPFVLLALFFAFLGIFLFIYDFSCLVSSDALLLRSLGAKVRQLRCVADRTHRDRGNRKRCEEREKEEEEDENRRGRERKRIDGWVLVRYAQLRLLIKK